MPDIAPPGPADRTGEAGIDEMPRLPLYPSLFQMNTRVRLRELETTLGRPATLDDIPDAELDRIAAQGFDWVYCLGVWSTGEVGRQVSRSNQEWRREFEALLPDLDERDICGSSFAVTAYAAHPALGGDAALERLRRRLHARGLRLMLDFVPNHMAPDHPWTGSDQSSSYAGARRCWRRSRRTMRPSRQQPVPWCWRMAAIPTFRDGRTRCNWTTATRPRAKPCAASCSPQLRSAMACAATWQC